MSEKQAGGESKRENKRETEPETETEKRIRFPYVGLDYIFPK